MIDRDKLLKERERQLMKLTKQQVRLINKAAKIAGNPRKTLLGQMRNLGKAMAIAFQVRGIEIQKRIILSQPIPKKDFPPGAAIVGEHGPEMIMMPGDSQNCAIAPMVHIPIQNKKND
jgi:hypothetical protein